MRFIFLLLLSLLANFTFASASLADDFGERFYNEPPKGLGDFTAESDEIPDIAMDEAAKDLQDIMPAAGDEAEGESETASDVEVNAKDIADTAPVQIDEASAE